MKTVKQKLMYTCEHGLKRYKNAEQFWAWDEKDIEESVYQIVASDDAFDVEDEGLYFIHDISSVDFLND